MSAIEIIQPGGALALNPESSGFAHGFGIFETMRVRRGRLELWEAHWRRFIASAEALRLACPYPSVEVLEAVISLAKKLPADAVIKLSLLRDGDSSKLVVYSRPLSPLPEDTGLLVESPAPINEYSPLAGHKTHNYLENLLVLEAAHATGCYDGLRLNSKGDIVEGALSNVFFHRGGGWHTPATETGLLPGVVREVLLDTLTVEQGRYGPTDLLSADAVFLTNASIGLQPVDWLLSAGRKLPLSSRLHPCFEPASALIEEYIEKPAIQVS